MSFTVYVVLDFTPVSVFDVPDAPAQVDTPDPASEHVHLTVTPDVVFLFDTEHDIDGFMLSIHVAVYVAFAVGGFVIVGSEHVYPVLVAVGTVIFPPDQ